MKHVGSKRRIWPYIAPLILSGRRDNQLYVEAFVGGANSFMHVENPRLGADINPYIVACLAAARDGWIPPNTVTEAEYYAIRDNMSAYPPELVGFVGVGCSFGAKWWGGYARGNVKSKKVWVDGKSIISRIPSKHALWSSNEIIEQALYLRGATLLHSAYDALDIPDGSLCYLDPPYQGTTGYKQSGAFDHAAFWRWADDLAGRCRVFVSEYNAPAGWISIWQKTQLTNIDNKRGVAFKAQERLFVPESQLRRLL